jgi:hypothetical protein
MLELKDVGGKEARIGHIQLVHINRVSLSMLGLSRVFG